MDRARFSIIAHGDLPFWNPVSEASLLDLVGRVPLTPGSRVLDVGCGRARLLLEILSRVPCRCVGVDRIGPVLEEVQRANPGWVDGGNLDLRAGDFEAAAFGSASFDLAMCIGSTHAIGGYPETLRTLRGLVRSGGHILVGEGNWMSDPPASYLEFLQMEASDHLTPEGNVAAGADLGLAPAGAAEASLEDWDRYEGTYAENVRRFVREHPDDPDAADMLARIEPWNATYLREGRGVLGFGLYLFKVPRG